MRPRRLGRLFKHGSALKSLSKLGLGPPCPTCGRPMTRWMTESHREAVEAVTGHPPEEVDGVCRCPVLEPGEGVHLAPRVLRRADLDE